MQIEVGTQPNCSELVIRLGTNDRDVALDILRKIGIDEYLVKNRYDFDERQGEWDKSDNKPRIRSVKDLPNKVRKAYHTWNRGDSDAKVKAAVKLLSEHDIDPGQDSFVLMEEGGTVITDAWLTNYPYGNDDELGIMYSQHCTTQGFPMLKKISEFVGEKVEAHDGGSILYYDAFLEGRDPFEDEE